MHKGYAITVLMAVLSTANAVELNFSRITGNEEGFRQFWQLEPEEMKRYQAYMEVVGKYRHQNTDPLTVLTIIADSPEDRLVYARRAAEFEHQMVKREIESAWHISEAMSVARLEDDMQQFTDELIGIDTRDYAPGSRELVWHDEDSLVLVVDELCLEGDCLEKFREIIEKVPQSAPRAMVLMGRKPLSDAGDAIVKRWGMTVSRFDPIEHADLKGHANRVLQMREHRVVAPLTVLSRITLPKS